MNLSRITRANLVMAVEVARAIFPYEETRTGVFWPGVAYLESIAEDRPDFAYYLASKANTVVGITGHRPDQDDLNIMWVGWFGILPEFRAKGLGTELFCQTKMLVRRFERPELWLYARARKDLRAAHRLYLREEMHEMSRGYINRCPVIYFKERRFGDIQQLKNSDLSFYEVELSDCDSKSLIVHVYSDGTHKIRSGGTVTRLKRLIRYYREPDAPPFVEEWAKKLCARYGIPLPQR